MDVKKKYKIEHKILSLSHCAVMKNGEKPTSFVSEGIEFSHWDFNHRDGWLTNSWIAYAEVESTDFLKAVNDFRKNLFRIIPSISLISQSYIEYTSEPFLVHEISSNIAYFRYIEDRIGGGLMFMEKDEKALKKLLENKNIPDEFYNYWNDAVNTIGYSAKLLLMFSAIEALVKVNGKKDWMLLDNILGKELVKELFGTKEEPHMGLRHRLVHGEYFGDQDNGKNYLELIHKKVISYFNTSVFNEPLISENVVQPQRHFWGNKGEAQLFLENKDHTNLFNLKDLLNDFDNYKDNLNVSEKYQRIFDKKIIEGY